MQYHAKVRERTGCPRRPDGGGARKAVRAFGTGVNSCPLEERPHGRNIFRFIVNNTRVIWVIRT